MIKPQQMLMYIGAIFASLLAIAIFKDFRDNGTELIIVTKQLTRIRVVSIKFIVYILCCIIFGVFTALFTLFVLTFNSVTVDQAISLFLSVIIATTLFSLLFGFFACLVSIYLNKI
jgi:ABC-type transport system involved in multi-copper enzyme maturation permease subunit